MIILIKELVDLLVASKKLHVSWLYESFTLPLEYLEDLYHSKINFLSILFYYIRIWNLHLVLKLKIFLFTFSMLL